MFGCQLLKQWFKRPSEKASHNQAIKTTILKCCEQKNICLDIKQVQALDAFEALLNNKLPQVGLFLYGGVGTGKTLLMDTFFESFKGRKNRLHHYELLKHLMQGMYKNNQQKDPLQQTIEQICPPQSVLGIDDFYLRDIADAKLWQKVFEYCLKHRQRLIITSNQHPQSTLINSPSNQERIARLIDSMVKNLNILKIDAGVDYRSLLSNALDTEQSALVPLNIFKPMLEKITQGQTKQQSKQLIIQQRKINAEAIYTDTVIFSFSELFQGKRAYQDYIEISERFNTLCLVDYQQNMFASPSTLQRLIGFIDIIYDKKIRLFWFADSLPLSTLRQSYNPHLGRMMSRLQQMFALSNTS